MSSPGLGLGGVKSCRYNRRACRYKWHPRPQGPTLLAFGGSFRKVETVPIDNHPLMPR